MRERAARRDEATDRCAAIAARQLGLITRAQLMDAGMTERAIDYRLATGGLIRCLAGVYRYPAAPTNWTQRLLAACLWADGVASHLSAAALWKMAGIAPGPIELTAARSLRAPHGIVVHRVANMRNGDRGWLGAIPVTSPTRTMIDLSSQIDAEDLELALDDALHRRILTLPRLTDSVAAIGTRGRRGTAALQVLIKGLERQPRVPTKFERLLAAVLEGVPLPRFVREHEVMGRGRVVARIDFAYPKQKVGVEADSFKWHSSPEAFRRDRERSNALTQLGWRIHRATWRETLDRPGELRGAVASLLGITSLRI